MVKKVFLFIVGSNMRERKIFSIKKEDRHIIQKPMALTIIVVFFVSLNHFHLSLMQIPTYFYINYIIYYGLLIFCCQNVAIFPDKL